MQNLLAKCPFKKQNIRQLNKICESANRGTDKRHKNHTEDWKKAQDQPQFSNKNNRCLNCVDDHKTMIVQ